jgi:hypothetical protein
MQRFLTASFVLPLVGLLVAGIAALGVAYALKDGGSTTTELVVESCELGVDPDCKLRDGVHEHADFAVFIRGEQFDFSEGDFLSIEGEDHHPYLHIHPPRYTVVHVHLSRSTWAEFFESIGIEFKDGTLQGVEDATTCMTFPGEEPLCNTETERWRFFRNGVEVDGMAFTEVQDMERVLITYGASEDEIAEQIAAVSDESCISSGFCEERRLPGEEEPCSSTDSQCTG